MERLDDDMRPDEIFALSENPVVSDRVIFNFRERPRVAAVYTLNGARVADLLARMTSDGRVEWDLTNEKDPPSRRGSTWWSSTWVASS